MATDSQRPSAPRQPVPVVVQVVDQLADIAAVVCLTVLCARGRLSGELTLVGIGAVLGVQTGLRHGLAGVGRSTGAVGLALLALGPAAATAARHLALWGVLAVVLLLGCGPRPVSEAAMLLAPTTPQPTGCAPLGATRCRGAVPEACGESGRWWPLPACPGGCEVTDAGARCAVVDAGVVE